LFDNKDIGNRARISNLRSILAIIKINDKTKDAGSQ